MLERLTHRLRHRNDDEQGYALILSIILLTVLAAVVAIMSLNTVSNLQSMTTSRDATYFDIATESAVSDAIRMANDPKAGENLADHIGKSRSVYGEVEEHEQYKWRWYLRPVENSYTGLSYDLYATGYRGDDPDNPNTSRDVIVRLASFPTTGARWVGESVFYRPTHNSVYSWGIFGGDSVSLSGNTTTTSFDSTTGANNLGGDVVGTNGILTTSSGTTVSRILMMNSYPGNSATERCTGDACQPSIINDARYGMDLSVVSEWVEEACPADAGPYPDVIGSTITIDAKSPNCFNNVSLEGDVNINYTNGQPSTGRPASVYIAGNLDMGIGTEFNDSGNSSISGAMIMRVYVAGERADFSATGSGSSGSDIRMLLATSDTTACNIGAPSVSTEFWGALVCGSLNSSGSVQLNWDEQTKAIAVETDSSIGRIWNTTGYTNTY